MYIIQRKNDDDSISYYTYSGWVTYTKDSDVLDLTDVVRFTEREALRNELGSKYKWQWFGSYR